MARYWKLCSLFCCLALVPGLWAAADSLPKTSADDWPQWRGPHRDGVSSDKGLLQEWPKEGPPLAWEIKGLGQGFSSVAIAGDRIFTMGAHKGGQFLIALNRANGKELWAVPVGKGGGSPQSTPTVDGDLVFALSKGGDLVCADVAKGEIKWQKNFPRDLDGKMMSGWGYSESPLVDGDKLVCTPGGKTATLAALNKRTGEVIWKAAVPGGDGAGYASIMVSEAGGIRQYVQLLGRGIVGVAAKDGKFLWRYDRVANGTANIPTAIVQDDYVFCSTGYGKGAALLKLEPKDDGIEAKEVYFLQAKVLQNHHGGMVRVGDYIYGGHGHNQGFPICLEMKTGKVAWRQDRGPGTGSAAVVYANGDMYFRYQNGLMALIAASPEAYQLKGSFKIPHSGNQPSWSHPVVVGGKLYLREQDWLLCFDLKKK